MTVRAYLNQAVGPHQVVQDHTWPHRASTVLEVRDVSGTSWFVKRHSTAERFRAELAAYRKWVPALTDRAPVLHHHDDELRVLVLTPVQGQPVRDDSASISRQAGALLRRFHDAEPEEVWTDFAADRAEQLQRWSRAAVGLVERDVIDFVCSWVTGLAQLPAPVRVPCHLDYSPRNWLVEAGRLSVVDFEWCRLDVWVNDLTRLSFGSWTSRPDLQESFLEGYGRTLSVTEKVVLEVCSAVHALELVVRARQYGERALEASSRAALHRITRSPDS